MVSPAPPIVGPVACASVPLNATVSAPIVTMPPAAMAAAISFTRAPITREFSLFEFTSDAPFRICVPLVPLGTSCRIFRNWILTPGGDFCCAPRRSQIGQRDSQRTHRLWPSDANVPVARLSAVGVYGQSPPAKGVAFTVGVAATVASDVGAAD